MSRPRRVLAIVLLIAPLFACVDTAPDAVLDRSDRYHTIVDLPAPVVTGTISAEAAIAERRSVRDYGTADLELAELAQLFWAAQGVTGDQGHRAAPSAGALYPLELYAVTSDSLMHYLPDGHRVEVGDAPAQIGELAAAAFGQDWIGAAPTVLVISGVVTRLEAKYGAVSERLMDREAGHAAQNVLLAAVALDLGSVPVGGFDPAEVARLLALAPGEEPLYLIPIGHPA